MMIKPAPQSLAPCLLRHLKPSNQTPIVPNSCLAFNSGSNDALRRQLCQKFLWALNQFQSGFHQHVLDCQNQLCRQFVCRSGNCGNSGNSGNSGLFQGTPAAPPLRPPPPTSRRSCSIDNMHRRLLAIPPSSCFPNRLLVVPRRTATACTHRTLCTLYLPDNCR